MNKLNTTSVSHHRPRLNWTIQTAVAMRVNRVLCRPAGLSIEQHEGSSDVWRLVPIHSMYVFSYGITYTPLTDAYQN